jgi:hypothetical protein
MDRLRPRSRLHITNRSKPAFRSLRDEALTKFGEFIGVGSFPSVIRLHLCEAAPGLARRGVIGHMQTVHSEYADIAFFDSNERALVAQAISFESIESNPLLLARRWSAARTQQSVLLVLLGSSKSN